MRIARRRNAIASSDRRDLAARLGVPVVETPFDEKAGRKITRLLRKHI